MVEGAENGWKLLKEYGTIETEMPTRPVARSSFSLLIEYEREADGRWLADIPALPGVTAYGRTKKQATGAVQALALRLIADRLEHGEAVPGPMEVSFIAA
jgi:predicted RNase H-like HicB family nuclease